MKHKDKDRIRVCPICGCLKNSHSEKELNECRKAEELE